MISPHSTWESTIFGVGFVVAKGHEVETHKAECKTGRSVANIKLLCPKGYATLLALKCNNMCMKYCQSRMLTLALLSRAFIEASLTWMIYCPHG